MPDKRGMFGTCKKCMMGRDETFKCYPFCPQLRDEAKAEITIYEDVIRSLKEKLTKAEKQLAMMNKDYRNALDFLGEARQRNDQMKAKLKEAKAIRRHDVNGAMSLYAIAKNDLKKAQKEIKGLKAKIDDLREVGENDLDGG